MAPKREVKPMIEEEEEEGLSDHLDSSEEGEEVDDVAGEDSEVSEEEEEDDDDEEAEDGPPRKKAKKDYSLPTADEMMRVKETEELFKNNLFRLEIEELLKEVSVDYAKCKPLEGFLRMLKDALESLPDAEIRAADLVKTPGLLLKKTDKDVFMSFKAPAALHLVGSYLLRTVTKPVLNIDIALDIPKECFLEKDLLDNRYHNKRSMYLHHVASQLVQSELIDSVEVEGFHGDITKPVLVLHPSSKAELNKLSKKFAVRFFPMVSADVFKLARLGPDRNNVRIGENGSANNCPTPFYNNSILEDIFFRYHLEVLHAALADNQALVEAVSMMKVWLRRRHLSQGRDGISGFAMTMFMVHLLQSKRINKHMSAYQIFKVVLESIRTMDLTKGVTAMKPFGAFEDIAEGVDVEKFDGVFDVTLLDPSRCLNLFARVSSAAYHTMRNEASLSLVALDDNLHDGFETVFVTEWMFFAKYDNYVKINVGDSATSTPKMLKNRYADYPLSIRRNFGVAEVLRTALSRRVTNIGVRACPRQRWALTSSPEEDNKIVLGLSLAEDAATSIVEMGPSAEDEEKASTFRDMWGERSELRRFKDGAIVEAVVWEEARDQKHNLVQFACKYLLNLHFKFTPAAVQYVSAPLEHLLNVSGHDGISSSIIAMAAFTQLNKHIRALEELPLAIRNITPMSPTLRQTATYPPSPNMNAGYVTRQGQTRHPHKSVSRAIEPIEVVLEFESSSRWPETIPAINHTKAAFYLKLAAGLEESFGVTSVPTMEFVDVIFAGFVFRFHIFYEGELVKLRRMDPKKTELIEHKLVDRPRHAQVINGVNSRFPGYSQTVRLAKRWVEAHMFGESLCEEAVELLCAHLFVSPQLYERPETGLSGFMRFLDMLQSFDWEAQPLVVDIDKELNAAAHQKIMDAFHDKPRNAQPAMYIVTNRDRESREWTRNSPSSAVVKRMQLYAARSVASLVDVFEGSQWATQKAWDSVFVTPANIYDFAIRLAPEKVPNVHVNNSVSVSKSAYDSKKYKNIGGGVQELLVGFNPVEQMLSALRERFSDHAQFYYDHHGGTTIYGTWKPKPFFCSPFKVAAAQGKIPINRAIMDQSKAGKKAKGVSKADKNKAVMELVPNVFEMLNDMKEMGSGLVADVEVLPRC